MVYQVPASKASIKQNRFEFQLPGSRKIHSVPLLKYLKPSIVLELEEASEVAAAKALFMAYLPEAFAQFEDSDQLEAFFEAWRDASGISLGESEASATS